MQVGWQISRCRMSRSIGKGPIRHYIYISDSKLDMYFEQIDRGVLKRISAEVKVDLKVASVTLRSADNPSSTRAAKLQIVERYIETHNHVGTWDRLFPRQPANGLYVDR
jgi:hypothetical protein